MVKAQSLKVEDFKLLETDLTANLHGTTVLDQNGEKCALIKIVTTEQGFTFDVGSLGISKTEPKTGEIWVYVPRGVRRITLNHQTFGRVEFAFPIAIQGSKTYEMVLKADRPVVNDTPQQVTISVSPASATLIVDNGIVETDNGHATIKLKPGEHMYSVAAKGYVGQSGKMTILPDTPFKLTLELDMKKSGEKALVAKEVVEEKPVVEVAAGDKVATVEGVGEMFTLGKVQFLMVNVEHGTFTIGAHRNQKSPDPQEIPAHEVTLTKDFAIGETEVTQELWYEVMGNNPSGNQNSVNLPVEQVSWDDCQEFCKELSRRTGRTFRLPTNAEWEYAARGGHKSKDYIYSGSNTAADVAWYERNADNSMHEVKQKMPNELGLYDMSGNAWEWCLDNFVNYSRAKQTDPMIKTMGDDEEYTIRSGSFMYPANTMRTSFRYYMSAGYFDTTLGLRVVMEMP